MVRKTHRRSRHTKRRTHRRRTSKRGGANSCESLKKQFEALTGRVHLMRKGTYENKWSRVRALYNNTAKKGFTNTDCARLAEKIEDFEQTVLSNETRKLHE